MNTYFYVVAAQNGLIRSFIDLLRFVANPNEKRTAHITVRGPYTKKVNLSQKSSEIVGQRITITGADCFFSRSQSTVYLKCESDALKKVWQKKGYDYKPHITIYDGKDRAFAESILNSLTKYNYRFIFTSTYLIPLLICKGQLDIDLSIAADFALLGRLLKREIDIDLLRSMSDSQRGVIFLELSSFLPHLSQQ